MAGLPDRIDVDARRNKRLGSEHGGQHKWQNTVMQVEVRSPGTCRGCAQHATRPSMSRELRELLGKTLKAMSTLRQCAGGNAIW